MAPHYSAPTYRAGQSIGYLVRRASNLMTSKVEAAFANHEITFSQWLILMQLRDGLNNTAAEICRDIGHDSGALTRAIDQLELQSLLNRRRSCKDRRVVELSLTPKGRQVVDSLVPLVVDRLNCATAAFSPAEMATLVSLLTSLVTQIQSPSAAGVAASLETTS